MKKALFVCVRACVSECVCVKINNVIKVKYKKNRLYKQVRFNEKIK